MREIPIAGMPRPGGSGAPLQAEALAHFARMTVPPGEAFRTAFNEAVYRWKQAGLWALIKGLWVLCADTSQGALLSAIGDTPRDAVAVGALPTFTALKGFSAFDDTHRVKFPITAAILGSNDVLPFLAGKVTPKPTGSDSWFDGALIQSDAGSAHTTPGNFVMVANATSPTVKPWLRWPGGTDKPGLLCPAQLVFGYKFRFYIFPGSSGGEYSGSIDSGPSSNYLTGPTNTPLERLCAYGFLADTATVAQGAKFLSILANMLDQLGAQD